MKKILLSLTLIVFCIAWSGVSSATLIGTYDGNDNGLSYTDFVDAFYQQTDYTSDTIDWDWDTFTFYGKNDFYLTDNSASSPDFTDTEYEGSYLEVEGELDSGELYSGTFTTADAINFYSVKANGYYSLYWVDPESSSVAWTTADLNEEYGTDYAMSHISTWTVDRSSAPVPEPGTMILVGSGLLGLIGIGRLKFTSKA